MLNGRAEGECDATRDDARKNVSFSLESEEILPVFWGRTFPKEDKVVCDYLNGVADEIEDALERRVVASGNAPLRLTQAMRYSLLAKGKRLRPSLAALAADLCGKRDDNLRAAQVALEVVHVYSLIHDDLPAMDNDDFRRGIPTCHKRFDEATAILAGDALLTLAFEILSTQITDATIAVRLVAELSRAIGVDGMVGGQADDVLWSKVTQAAPGAIDLFVEALGRTDDARSDVNERDKRLGALLNRIHRRKTGALITTSLIFGAVCARANSAQTRVLYEFGENLGRAFQISDDLLDAVGNVEAVGKRLQKDEEEGKLTYISLYGVDKTKQFLFETVERAKNALLNSNEFDRSSTAFHAAVFLAEQIARRER